MNKKGDLTGIIFFIVSIAAFGIFLLILGYIAPQITQPLAEKIGINAEINNSLNATKAVAEQTLPTVWLVVFGGLLLGLFATSFFIQTHPIFVPIFIFLLIIAVVIAVPLSNTYEALTNNAILSGTANQQGLITFILLHLPTVAFIVGLMSMLIAFAKPGGGQASLG